MADKILNLNERNLCEECIHKKEIISGRGSRFIMCSMSQIDKRFPKYPRQPIIKCSGYSATG